MLLLLFAATGGLLGIGGITDGAETTVATAEVRVASIGTISDSGETVSSSGTVRMLGAGAIAESAETVAGTSVARVGAAGSVSEVGETAAGTASGRITGSSGVSDGAESLGGSATALVGGSGGISEGDEALSGAGAGQTTIAGTGLLIEASDTLQALVVLRGGMTMDTPPPIAVLTNDADLPSGSDPDFERASFTTDFNIGTELEREADLSTAAIVND